MKADERLNYIRLKAEEMEREKQKKKKKARVFKDTRPIELVRKPKCDIFF